MIATLLGPCPIERIYDELGGAAYSLAFAVSRDETRASSSVCTAFAEIEAGRRGNPTHQLQGFEVLEVVRRHAVETIRQERAHGSARPDMCDGTVAWESTGSLALLPGKQRRLLELQYIGGYRQGEVADLLGISLEEVRRETRCALACLRDAQRRTEPGVSPPANRSRLSVA